MYDLTDHALRRSIEGYSENSAVSRIARSIRYIYMATWLLLGKAPIVRVGGSKDLPLMQSGWAGEGGGGRIQGQSRVRRGNSSQGCLVPFFGGSLSFPCERPQKATRTPRCLRPSKLAIGMFFWQTSGLLPFLDSTPSDRHSLERSRCLRSIAYHHIEAKMSSSLRSRKHDKDAN